MQRKKHEAHRPQTHNSGQLTDNAAYVSDTASRRRSGAGRTVCGVQKKAGEEDAVIQQEGVVLTRQGCASQRPRKRLCVFAQQRSVFRHWEGMTVGSQGLPPHRSGCARTVGGPDG